MLPRGLSTGIHPARWKVSTWRESIVTRGTFPHQGWGLGGVIFYLHTKAYACTGVADHIDQLEFCAVSPQPLLLKNIEVNECTHSTSTSNQDYYLWSTCANHVVAEDAERAVILHVRRLDRIVKKCQNPGNVSGFGVRVSRYFSATLYSLHLDSESIALLIGKRCSRSWSGWRLCPRCWSRCGVGPPKACWPWGTDSMRPLSTLDRSPLLNSYFWHTLADGLWEPGSPFREPWSESWKIRRVRCWSPTTLVGPGPWPGPGCSMIGTLRMNSNPPGLRRRRRTTKSSCNKSIGQPLSELKVNLEDVIHKQRTLCSPSLGVLLAYVHVSGSFVPFEPPVSLLLSCKDHVLYEVLQ